ncbi:hypothetical protein [Nonomuraea soli]|uniref:Uncharacterized protein n=1 Tax=Nonomuraea soli TaxID=1032476 RepID=A0A7W0CUH9_9ACTN|nr:hypothetical protein [Nonomuraea soli]MBA2897423.1 hypothetical protein [Nonomuraea soli]
MAVLREQGGEVGGDLRLPATGEANLEDLLVRLVGGGARRGQALQLVGRGAAAS